MAQPQEHSLLVEDHNSNSAVAIPITTGGLFHAGNWTPLKRDPGGYWTIYPAKDGTEQDPAVSLTPLRTFSTESETSFDT